MNQKFLNNLAEEVYRSYNSSLQNVCIVFPSRRAGTFFREQLKDMIEKPVWALQIFDLESFISELSPFKIEEKLVLIFELFEVYRKHIPGESFDKFYPWGEMILGDFDAIDKFLVPAKTIFRIIREQKELDESFEFNFGDYELFCAFWKTFSSRDLTENQKDFLKTWEILGKVYDEFRSRLLERNIGYEGMAYRKIYEDIRTNKLDLKWDKIIFAGFNSLNAAETGILNELLKQNKAQIFWDSDSYYINDNHQEAGNFIRKNFAALSDTDPKWIDSNLISEEIKNIKITGAPFRASQAKALAGELQKLIQENNIAGTAIVLPDESMLMPLVHSMPSEIESYNVTMGFPFKSTPLFSLIEILKSLQKNKKGTADKPVFYHKDAVALLNHPYIRNIDEDHTQLLSAKINSANIIYVSSAQLQNTSKEIYSVIFKAVEGTGNIILYLRNIIDRLNMLFIDSSSINNEFDREYIYNLEKQLNRLTDIIVRNKTQIEGDTFWNLLVEILLTSKIPFSGEPINDLQVMGLLETRSLDFENVFILNVNEGVLPKGDTSSSFIPFNLRKAFRMPTFEDDDSIAAYYFYRLIQRAKNVYLFYNTESGNLSTGEKSRFIMQIESELAAANKNINVTGGILDIPAVLIPIKEISVDKDNEVIKKLLEFKGFSATALTSYITCPLKFYLERIARLREDENVEEFFSGATFGNIFHEVMHILYSGHKNKKINPEDIDLLREKLNSKFEQILEQAFITLNEERAFVSELQGKNLLYKGIIKKLAEKILEIDAKNAPFEITEIENKYDLPLGFKTNNAEYNINLHGRIDRVDLRKGIVYVLDYKTGKVTSKPFKEETIENLFTDPEYKEYFQTLFYSLLYTRVKKQNKIIAGLYPLRNISGGIRYLLDEFLPPQLINTFETGLRNLLTEIFDKNTPFKQTEDINRCKYCAYKGICRRD